MHQMLEKKRLLLDKIEINWIFTYKETLIFQMMWREGRGIESIATKLERSPLEIGLLIIEQAELGNIVPRDNGLF